MKIKFLVSQVLVLSVLAVSALAYDYYPYNDVPIGGAQLTDWPSERANVTVTGSFLRPEPSYAGRYAHWYRRSYRDWYRDHYDDGR